MDIGISTASLFMREYNEDALVTLDNLDARVVEVFLQSFSEYKPEYGKLLLKRNYLPQTKGHGMTYIRFLPMFFILPICWARRVIHCTAGRELNITGRTTIS